MKEHTALRNFDFNQAEEAILENESIEFKRQRVDIQNISNGVSILEEECSYSTLFNDRTTSKENLIVICTKDMEKELKFILSKMIEFKIEKTSDVLIVDDRSKSNGIDTICKEENLSYLRLDNTLNEFNYSVINNIAATYAKKLGKKTITFWNNDLWPSSETSFQNILSKHRELNSSITGTRLVYPNLKTYQDVFGKYKQTTEENKEFNTIQHGGIHFVLRDSFIEGAKYPMPFHRLRFEKKNDKEGSKDTENLPVTGALHIVNLDDFINKMKGFAPYLATSFQDIDLCLNAIIVNKLKVNYIGSEYMYHAESICLNNEGYINSSSTQSDAILYQMTWNQK